jgi:hypothetical protein
MVFFIPWRVVAEESGAAHFGLGGAFGLARAPNRWWRLAALKDQRKIPAFTILLTHSRARSADDRGRRRRDASYGAARDSHPVSTIR